MSLVKSLVKGAVSAKISRDMAGSRLVNAGVGIAAAHLASRSIPGALLVGGAYLAKKAYDRKKSEEDEALTKG